MSSINGVEFQPGEWSGRRYKAMPYHFDGPNELRDAVIAHMGIEWTASYLDQCSGWNPDTHSISANTSFAFRQMRANYGAKMLFAQLKITLLDPKTGGPNGKGPLHPLSTDGNEPDPPRRGARRPQRADWAVA